MELEKELAYFKKHKKELLENYEGQFVLIRGKELVGSFTTEQEAYEEGVKRFGNEAFLIKEVTAGEEETAYFPALTLGLVHADTQ